MASGIGDARWEFVAAAGGEQEAKVLRSAWTSAPEVKGLTDMRQVSPGEGNTLLISGAARTEVTPTWLPRRHGRVAMFSQRARSTPGSRAEQPESAETQ